MDVLPKGGVMGVGLGHGTMVYPAYDCRWKVACPFPRKSRMKRLSSEERVTLDGRFSLLESVPYDPETGSEARSANLFGGHAEAAI